jgi:hypothetical protein
MEFSNRNYWNFIHIIFMGVRTHDLPMATSNVNDAPTSTEDVGRTSRNGAIARVATVTISDANLDAIGIRELVSSWRRADIRAFEVLAGDRRGAVVQIEVVDRLVEERLTAVDAVSRWEHVATTGDRERYVLEVTVPAFSPGLADSDGGLFGTIDVSVTAHGLAVTLVGTHAAIGDVVDDYERLGLAPDLRSLVPYEGPDRSLDVLTERQREVVRTAYELGYYEVPRETTTEDVASELGVDASTVTEHLQRAERNLLGRYLSN